MITPILQTRSLRLRDIKRLVQGHTARMQTQGCPTLELMQSPPYLVASKK